MDEPSLIDIERSFDPGAPRAGGRAPRICGDIDMRIGRDGGWFYHGSPVGRKPLIRLFARVLRRDDAGDYWLETPVEKCRIRVDDAPFTAVAMEVEGAGRARRISFRTNVDDVVTAGPAHPIRVAVRPETGEPSPYVLVRGRLEARILRAVFYDLVELGEERPSAGGPDFGPDFGVWSGGGFFPLGRLDGA